MNTRNRSAVLVALVGLVAPVSLGLAGASTAHAATATAHRDPASRYLIALVNKKEVKKGKKVTIYGSIQSDVSACAVGQLMTVQRAAGGSAVYRQIDTVTTDATASYSIKETVTKKSRFRIVAPATDTCTDMQSPPRTVKILGQD